MATLYVDWLNGNDANNGSTGSPVKTPQRADTLASSGDTIKLRGSSAANTHYRAQLKINKANTTWEPDTGHTPIFNGGWDDSYLRADGTYNWPDATCLPNIGTPGTPSFKEYGVMVQVAANGVTVDSLDVRNVAGIAIVVTASNVAVTNCRVDHTFSNAINVNGEPGAPITDIEVGYCTISRVSFKGRISDFTQLTGKRGTQGSFIALYAHDVWLHHNTMCYGMAEGILADRGGNRVTIEYNVVHTNNHLGIYINRTKNAVIRNNLVAHTYNSDFIEDKKGAVDYQVPSGIVIGDENGPKMPLDYHSENQQVYNNIIIGMSCGIDVRNAYKLFPNGDPDGYTTQLKNAWIAHNTIIGRSRSMVGIRIDQVAPEWGSSLAHQNSIVENNLVNMAYGEAGYKLGIATGSMAGIAFRNNLWYGSTAAIAALPTAMRGAGDVYTAPQQVNPVAALPDTYPSPTIAHDWRNYALLRTSPAIGAASDRGRLNGLTPPTVTTDYNGATRSDLNAAAGQYYDIGALEYNGGAAVPTVTASFTASATSGAAPLSVTFTSTSSGSNGGAVDAWLWDFGDGTTATTQGPHTRIYTAPGSYSVTLTVYDTSRNPDLVDVSDTTTINVTATGGGVGGAYDAVRVAMRSGTGSQTIAFALNGAPPDIVLFFLSNATAAATKTDNALVAFGAAGPGGQWSAAVYSKDNASTTVTKRWFSETAAIISMDDAGLTGVASVTGYAANQVTLNVSDAFPAQYLVTAVALADSSHQAKVGILDLATQTAAQLGFGASFMALISTFQTAAGAISNNAILSTSFLGDYLGTAGSTAFSGNHLAFFSRHNQDTSDVRALLGAGGYDQLFSGAKGALVRRAARVDVVKDTTTTAVTGRAGYAALGLGNNQAVYDGLTPTSTGAVAYTTTASLGDTDNNGTVETETIEPGLLILLVALRTAAASGAAADCESWALVIVDSGATYCLNVVDKDAAGTSDSWTRVDNSLAVRDSANTLKLAGAVSLTSTGFSINWTTVDSVQYPFRAVALRNPRSITGPVAAFTASPTTTTDGEVVFTDRSNANGSAITAWEWDFGDGGAATTQNPTYTYRQYGTYSVSLTVTNAGGSDSITRAGYITFDPPETAALMIGPYEPKTITNYTQSRLYGDDPNNADYGRVETALDLDSLFIDAAPANATSGRAGKIRIVADLSNNRLKVILPNGTVKYLNFA